MPEHKFFCLPLALLKSIAPRKTKIVYNSGLSECNRVKPIALRKAKIVYNFGLFECYSVNGWHNISEILLK